LAVDRGRITRPDIKVGICGEHGGRPDSIRFYRCIGLTYVSCSKPRVPIARLAAAHAALEENKHAGTQSMCSRLEGGMMPDGGRQASVGRPCFINES